MTTIAPSRPIDALGAHDAASVAVNANLGSSQRNSQPSSWSSTGTAAEFANSAAAQGLDVIDFQLNQDVSYSFWEKQIHALVIHLVKGKFMSVDELRRGIEALEPSLYNSLSYYDKWSASIITVLIERGTISRRDLEKQFADGEGSQKKRNNNNNSNIKNPPMFQVGDKVQVLTEQKLNRWRKPHLRTPGYLHEAVGTVEEILGQFLNPAYAAFRDLLKIDGGTQHEYLYQVSFPVKNIAVLKTSHSQEDYATGKVTADIFHPWLRKVGEEDSPDIDKTTRRSNSSSGVQVDPSGPGTLSQATVNAKVQVFNAFKKEEAELKKLGKVAPHGPHLDRVTTEGNAVCKEQDVAKDDAKVLKPLAEALIRVLVEKNVVTLKELLDGIQKMDALTGKPGGKAARMVAKAWVDPNFKRLLLKDANAAAASLGIQTSNYASQTPSTHPGASSDPSRQQQEQHQPHSTKYPHGTTVLRAVECTPDTHHLIVCTLCSCYPFALLGMSPDWYKSRSFRAQSVLRPREMLRESFGLALPGPEKMKIVVHDSTAEVRYIVVPSRPKGTEGWSEARLEKLVTRDSMIGVAQLPDVDTCIQSSDASRNISKL